MKETETVLDRPLPITGHPLAQRTFALIWAGLVVSVTGDALYRVALALSAAQNGASGLAGLGVALALPTAVVGLFAGVLIDRSHRVRLLIRTDLARCAIVAVLGVLLLRGHGSQLGVLAIAALLAIVSVIFMPALQSVLPELAGHDRDRLISMDAWILGAMSTVGVLGPAVAGLLLHFVGTAFLMFLDAATFAFSALMILLARPPAPAVVDSPSDKAWPGKKAALADGLRFLVRHPVLGPCFTTFPFMDFAYNSVPFVLPLMLRGFHADASERYGALLAALAAGRVLGMTLINKTSLKTRRGSVLRFNFLGQGVGMLLFAATGGSWLGVVPMALAGIPGGAAQVAMSSYVQLEVDPAMRGRVFTALISMVTWLAPLGPVTFLGLAALAGPPVAFAGIAAVMLAGGVRLFLCRPLAAVS